MKEFGPSGRIFSYLQPLTGCSCGNLSSAFSLPGWGPGSSLPVLVSLWLFLALWITWVWAVSSAWRSGSAHPPSRSASEPSHPLPVWACGRSAGSLLCCLPRFPGASGTPGPLDRELLGQAQSQGFPPLTTVDHQTCLDVAIAKPGSLGSGSPFPEP